MIPDDDVPPDSFIGQLRAVRAAVCVLGAEIEVEFVRFDGWLRRRVPWFMAVVDWVYHDSPLAWLARTLFPPDK